MITGSVGAKLRRRVAIGPKRSVASGCFQTGGRIETRTVVDRSAMLWLWDTHVVHKVREWFHRASRSVQHLPVEVLVHPT